MQEFPDRSSIGESAFEGKQSAAQSAPRSSSSSTPHSQSSTSGRGSDPRSQPNWPDLAGRTPTQVERVAELDALKRTAITSALAGILRKRDDVSPMAIGLFGEWGSGKSSQIQFLKDEIRRAPANAPAVKVVEFNAWEHEKCDNLSAALAQTVVDHLIKGTSLSEQWTLARQLQACKRKHITEAARKDWRALGYWLGPLLSPELAVAGLFVVLIFLTNMQPVAKFSGAAFAAAIGAWKTFDRYISANLANWFKRIASGARSGPFGLPDYAAKLGSFHDIRETLGHLVSLRVDNEADPRKGEYLLIIVDDLDRCNVETIKLVLDAVRLVTNMPRVVTLVSVDARIMFSAVESFYAQFRSEARAPSAVAREFLAKVFNVSVSLPPVSRQEAQDFIAQHLFIGNQRRERDGAGTGGPSSETPDISQADSAFVTKVEIEQFTKFALAIGMTNPRALWRMKQAWYLVRGLMVSLGKPLSDCGPWMRSLFLREAILALPVDAQRHIAYWAANATAATTTDSLRVQVAPFLTELLQQDVDGVASRWGYVDIFLLPAAGWTHQQEISAPM